jgi:glycine dehydrogenase
MGSLDEMVAKTVPNDILLGRELDLGKYNAGLTESDALAELKRIASQNKVLRSFIGMGYSDTKTPMVILRNVLENPGWYTQYTPYQPEVSQGRLECLVNFQTMVATLTGMEMCNSSLLDESTAAAEALAMISSAASKKTTFFVDDRVHPQTLAVVQTRAAGHGVTVVTGDYATFEAGPDVCGALVQCAPLPQPRPAPAPVPPRAPRRTLSFLSELTVPRLAGTPPPTARCSTTARLRTGCTRRAPSWRWPPTCSR